VSSLQQTDQVLQSQPLSALNCAFIELLVFCRELVFALICYATNKVDVVIVLSVCVSFCELCAIQIHVYFTLLYRIMEKVMG